MSANQKIKRTALLTTGYKKQAALALALAILSSLAAVALMFVGGYLISKTAQDGTTLYKIMIPVALVQLCGLAKPLLNYAQRLISHDWVLRISSKLRVHIFSTLLNFNIEQMRKYQSGDYIKLLVKDVEHVQNLYLRCIFPFICSFIVFIILCLVFACLSWQLLLCMTFLLAIVVVAMPLAAFICSHDSARRIDDYQNQLYTQLSDDILGSNDWKLSGRFSDALQKIKDIEKALRKEKLKVQRFMRANSFLQTCIFCTCILLLCYWSACTFGGAPQNDNFNFVAAFVLGFFPLIEIFSPLCEEAFQAQMHSLSIEHLQDLEAQQGGHNQEQRQEHGEHPSSNGEHHTSKKLSSNSDNTEYSIELKDLNFSYKDEPQSIFKDFNLNIKQGEKVAIIGKSGCGKSTLVDILAGQIRPQAGQVCIAGMPLTQIQEETYKLISIIDQYSYVFNRGVRQNIMLSNPYASDEEIYGALKAAQLLDFIQSLSNGLETEAQEAGARFSGGQKQRLLLARALLANTPIIVLDEPFNALDPHTQEALMRTFFDATQDKTLLVITHHLQDIEKFDRVIMLAKNSLGITEIEFDGAPKELLKTNEHFKQVYEFSSSGAD